MASILRDTTFGLIKMTSIERVVAPIATHLCHLILIFENEDVTEQIAGLERAAEDVAEATRSMSAVASRLSLESNDDIAKKEMEPVVASLTASGQHVLLAAQKLSIHPRQDEFKEELILSTQNVLLGVLKVLLVEDDAALRKIITAAHLLSDCLSQLEAALSIPLLLNSFQRFSETLLLLNELALKRAKDLRDTGQREHVFCSLGNLKRCISMLYTATHNSIKQPESTEAQAAKKYILDQAGSALADLVSTLKSNCCRRSINHKESYRMKLGSLLDLLSLPKNTLIADSSYDCLLHDLIIHSIVVAKSSRKNLKKTVVDDCQRVIQLWSETRQDENSQNCLSDHKNEDKYLSLKIQLEKLDYSVVRAILYQLLDVLVAAAVAFVDLMNTGGQPLCSHLIILDILHLPLNTFVSYTDKMFQVADFVSGLATNAKVMENIESFSASLQRLKGSVTILLIEIKENKECSGVLGKLQDLHLHWTEETSFLIDVLSHTVDLKEFIGVTVQEMKNHRCNCDRALEDENHIGFKEHCTKLFVCMNLVIQAAKIHIKKSNNPIFRNGLLVLVKQVEASVVNVRTSIKCIIAEHGLDIESAAVFCKAASVADEQFLLLRQGLNGVQHPHLLSPLREEARQPPVSVNLSAEEPDLNAVSEPEFIAAESENRNSFIQFHLNGLDKDSGKHPMTLSETESDSEVKTRVICDTNTVRGIKDLDLLPTLHKVVHAVKRKDLTVLNLMCTEVMEISNCYAQAVKMAVVVTDAESQQLENLKSETVALTHILVQTAQETAMSSFLSTNCIYKHLTVFSDKISKMRQILLPIAGAWYHAVCAVFQSEPQKTCADITQEISNVICSCAEMVDLVVSLDILQGEHLESVATVNKLRAAQVSAKELTEMVTSTPPGCDKLEATSILWALSIQVLLSSLDKILGVNVEGGTSLFSSHLTMQKNLALMSENSVRIQEASRVSSLICRNTGTAKNMRDLQQQVKSLTETYLQAAENLNTAPLCNLRLLSRTELLKRTLQVKVKVLCAVVSKVNEEYMDVIQHVIHLAVLAAAGNRCVEKTETAQLEFEKFVESLLCNMKAVSHKVQDCLNYVRNARVRAALRFTNEHLSPQLSDIVSRARKMVSSQGTYDLLNLEIHMHCWSAKAHFLVVELNKVEGIYPEIKLQITLGLQGKHLWDMPAKISSFQVEEKCPSKSIMASRPSDSARNITKQKIQSPLETEQLNKMDGNQPKTRRTEPSLIFISLYLKRETDKWDVQNNHIVQVTGDMAEKIHHMARYLRRKGPIQGKEAFVRAAKDIISSCQSVTQFVGFVTNHCLDKQCRDDLVRIMERISTTTNQFTIISSVNAVTPKCRSSDEILVKNAQNLLFVLLQGIRAAETACIKGLKQPEPDSEGVEAAALCYQWRQKLLTHQAQQNSNPDTDDLGLRKVCLHEAAPSLAPLIPMQKFYR